MAPPRVLLPPRTRPYAVAGIVVAGGITAVLGRTNGNGADSYAGVDTRIDNRLIAAFGHHPSLVHHLQLLGSPTAVATVTPILAVAMLLLNRPRAAGLAALAPPMAVTLTEWVLKPLVGRTFMGYGYAYPSGHTTGAAVLAFVFVVILSDRRRPRLPLPISITLAVTAIALTGLVAVAMIVSHAHYATDTVGGACVALASVLIVSLCVDAAAPHLMRP